MKNGQSYPPGPIQVHKAPIILGAVMVGTGGLIGLIGMLVSGTAMASACRQWFRELDMPPSDVVKQKWGQTKAATHAGTSAWQQHDGVQRTHA
jgi:hypothetical protein